MGAELHGQGCYTWTLHRQGVTHRKLHTYTYLHLHTTLTGYLAFLSSQAVDQVSCMSSYTFKEWTTIQLSTGLKLILLLKGSIQLSTTIRHLSY